MNGFIPCTHELQQLLPTIVCSEVLHAKWLNTLSYLENCGARKIAACQHPTRVKEEMLKHAAEEFRHAHHLKRQIVKVSSMIEDYSSAHILGGTVSLHYLMKLDLVVSRYLSHTIGLSKEAVKETAYLVVTYVIELRAGELYGLYDHALRKVHSKVTVKSILLEEEEHLREMNEELQRIPSGMTYANHACFLEGMLCQQWLQSIANEVQRVHCPLS